LDADVSDSDDDKRKLATYTSPDLDENEKDELGKG
jgi:hypothetical protein